jgi:SulP family sulfate permease
MSSTVILATVAVTVVSHNLALGVLIGVLLSGVFFTFKVARLMHVRAEFDAATGKLTYHVTGQVFFASADAFIEAFDLGARGEISVRIDVSQAHFWDVTAVAALDKIVGRYRVNGIPVKVVGMNQATATIVERLTVHDKERPEFSEH